MSLPGSNLRQERPEQMSDDNIQRKMDFIVEWQAKFAVDMDRMKEGMAELTQNIAELTEGMAELTEGMAELTEVQKQQGENINRLVETVTVIQVEAEANRVEMREAINNLIIANEGTRKLAEEVARLAIQTKHRVDILEEKQ